MVFTDQCYYIVPSQSTATVTSTVNKVNEVRVTPYITALGGTSPSDANAHRKDDYCIGES